MAMVSIAVTVTAWHIIKLNVRDTCTMQYSMELLGGATQQQNYVRCMPTGRPVFTQYYLKSLDKQQLWTKYITATLSSL